MAEPDPPGPEGWTVPQRAPLIVAGATLALIVILLLIAGAIYWRTLRPLRQSPVTRFPGPGVEAYVHAGALDPHTPPPAPLRDPAIEAAKRAVVAEGLPGWSATP